jgi:hypothetical protein
VEEHRTRYKLRIRVLDTKQIGMKHSKRRRASKSSQPYQHGNVTHCGAGVFHQSVDGNSVCGEALGASHNKGAYLLPCPCPCPCPPAPPLEMPPKFQTKSTKSSRLDKSEAGPCFPYPRYETLVQLEV